MKNWSLWKCSCQKNYPKKVEFICIANVFSKKSKFPSCWYKVFTWLELNKRRVCKQNKNSLYFVYQQQENKNIKSPTQTTQLIQCHDFDIKNILVSSRFSSQCECFVCMREKMSQVRVARLMTKLWLFFDNGYNVNKNSIYFINFDGWNLILTFQFRIEYGAIKTYNIRSSVTKRKFAIICSNFSIFAQQRISHTFSIH